MKDGKQSTLITVLLIIYLLILAGVILFKLPFYSPVISDGIRVINLIPFKGSFDENGALLLHEIMNNILIFIPLGIYICLLKREVPFIKKVTVILCTSLLFEILQFVFALGRTDITDIINNTLGGILGIGIIALLSRVFKNKTIKIISVLALVATVFIVLRFAHLFYLSHFVMARQVR